MSRHAIRQLNTDDYAAAARVYNHYVTTSTATFQTEPVTPDEWAAEALAGEPGRHGAWALLTPAPSMGSPADAGRGDAPLIREADAGRGNATGVPDADAPTTAEPAPEPRAAAGSVAAEVEGEATFAGYVLVTPFKARCAYRDTAEVTVYLAPGQTGRGLGRAALAHVDAHAAAAGLHALLAVVCAENDASLRAFERAGYQRCALLREVGSKFGRLLDVVYLERLVDRSIGSGSDY